MNSTPTYVGDLVACSVSVKKVEETHTKREHVNSTVGRT